MVEKMTAEEFVREMVRRSTASTCKDCPIWRPCLGMDTCKYIAEAARAMGVEVE